MKKNLLSYAMASILIITLSTSLLFSACGNYVNTATPSEAMSSDYSVIISQKPEPDPTIPHESLLPSYPVQSPSVSLDPSPYLPQDKWTILGDYSSGFAVAILTEEYAIWSNDDDKGGIYTFAILDSGGKLLFTINAATILPYSNDVFLVAIGGGWQIFDKNGNKIADTFIDSGRVGYFVSPFHDGLALICDWYASKYGYMNLNGELAIPFDYDEASNFENGLARVEKDGVAFHIDVDGNRQDK